MEFCAVVPVQNSYFMGQVFTVHIGQSDYEFQLIGLRQADREVESEILFRGNKLTLLKDAARGWMQKDGTGYIFNDLIRGIGNAISLRYRV